MNPFVDIEEMPVIPEEASGTSQSNVGGISIGSGSKSFRADSSGIWMGADTWAEAPFRVDMKGNMFASSAILTGSGYTKTVTFAQASIPTSVAVGDLWVDTDDKNKLYRAESVGADAITAGEWVEVDQDTYKLDKVGGSYTTTALTAAKVEIFPTTNIGIRAYASNGTSVVFQVDVGGTNVGDVLIGDYAGGSGMLWDNSESTLKIKGNIEAGNIDAARISTGTLSTSRIPNLSADKITTGYLSSSRIEAGSLNASVIGAGTINAQTISVENLNATNIKYGNYYVGGSVQPSSIIINRNGQDGFLTWTGGNKIWSDGSQYMGFTANGERFYFYTGSTLYALFQRGSSASFYSGLYSYGNFNVGESDDKYNSRFWGSVWINTSSSPSERLWVEGSAKITDNLKTDHHDPNGNKSYNLGGDSSAWDYVYADDYVTKSMGWYDDGVELQDGTVVSDMEAIRRIKPHKVAKNKNGSKELDWKTLPKCVFREAHDRDTGIPYKKNKDGIAISPETGELVGDGESLTHMTSLLMGALKEVDSRLLNIEKGIK